MAVMINSEYGYVTPEEAEMDARLNKWMKRRAKKHGAFNMQLKDDKNQLRIHNIPRAGNDMSC